MTTWGLETLAFSMAPSGSFAIKQSDDFTYRILPSVLFLLYPEALTVTGAVCMRHNNDLAPTNKARVCGGMVVETAVTQGLSPFIRVGGYISPLNSSPVTPHRFA